MSAALWLAAAIVLVIAEMFGGELVLLMLAGGALSAAGVDFVFEPPLWVDGVVFAVVSVLLLVAVRPVARRHMLNRPPVLMNTEALEGQAAVVTEQVDAREGRVKIGGDVWSARAMDPTQVIEPGTQVTVVEIDGATAVVFRA